MKTRFALRTGLIVLAAVLGLSLAAGMAAAPDAKSSLDGMSFAGESGEKGKPAMAEKDTIRFEKGRFRSAACDAYGFGDGAYTATAAGDGSVRWTAETTSPKEGRIQWQGTVKGDRIEATYVWTKAGQKPIEYWLKGTAQK
jgi:hypothetical protein